MSKFSDLTNETPRLVVRFVIKNNVETFDWGIVGKAAPLSLVGAITRAQSELFVEPGEACPEPALVIAWVNNSPTSEWFVHPSIPLEPLVGMLEVIKQIIISAVGEQVAKHTILGPDGYPIPRR